MGAVRDTIQVGVDILKSTVSDKTGRILLQIGNAIGQVAASDNVEQWQHNGFASRAPAAVPGKKAAQAVIVRRGSHDVSIAEQDERGLELYGNLADGETAVYAAGKDGNSQGRTLYKDDGSVTQYTTDTNTKDGKSVYARVAKGSDAATGAPDGFSWVGPWGTVKFDATGFHVRHISGASFSMGGISGQPAPLDQISSYITMQAGTINGIASAQSFGVGAPTPLALKEAVEKAIMSLQQQITALAGVIDVMPKGTLTPVVAAVPAIAAGTAAVSAAVTLLPATTSST
jgi:hypothetical protein